MTPFGILRRRCSPRLKGRERDWGAAGVVNLVAGARLFWSRETT